MGADPNDPIVDRSSLSGIMEDFHDRSRVLCLEYHDGGKGEIASSAPGF